MKLRNARHASLVAVAVAVVVVVVAAAADRAAGKGWRRYPAALTTFL
jgi:hypothetical protein